MSGSLTADEQARRLHAGSSFTDETFTGVTLTGADLGRKEFTGCVFDNCRLQETDWRDARLDECRFTGGDLTRMRPRGMRAHAVAFTGCKLMGVEWTALGQLPQLAFRECVLDYASFVDLSLRKTEFLACKIAEANFFDVDLREADFAGSDLTGAIFRGCTFDARTDLSTAIGLFLDPAVNHARGAAISLESAALLAVHLGLRVDGVGGPTPAARAPARRGKR
jgi:fluoroquinolone resistance protein